MWRILRDVRLIPVMLLAVGGLFVLKTMGIVFDGGYTLGERLAAREPAAEPEPPIVGNVQGTVIRQARSWASDVYNYPDVTGSVPDSGGGKPAGDMQLKISDKPPPVQPGPPDAAGQVAARLPSAGERAILERLGNRREEIEARNREIEMRENLLKAAEKRVEARIAELKDMEERVNSSVKKRDETEAARFKSLVSMYENMKAKDAARIFDRLDLRILVDVAMQMNPRRLSDILAAMTSEAAEKLTVELANRAGGAGQTAGKLPKIEGKPAGG